jgi:hypothetical protein
MSEAEEYHVRVIQLCAEAKVCLAYKVAMDLPNGCAFG